MEGKINRQPSSGIDIIRKMTQKGGGLTLDTHTIAYARNVLAQRPTQENRGSRNRASRTLRGFSHLPESHLSMIDEGATVVFDHRGNQLIFGLKKNNPQ